MNHALFIIVEKKRSIFHYYEITIFVPSSNTKHYTDSSNNEVIDLMIVLTILCKMFHKIFQIMLL